MTEFIRAINPYEKNEDGSYAVKADTVGKITGTFLGPIMGESPWQTEFTTACKILRIYDEDISDKPAVKAGKILESVILNYLDQSGRLPNTQAEVLFPGYEEGSHLEWKSHFEDEVFSGHIDAIAGRCIKGETSAYDGFGIVECKTTSNPSGWDFANNIPPAHYWLQASLYAYFFGYDTIYFTVGLLKPEDVDNPYKFIPTEDNVKVMKVGLYPDFEGVLAKAREWYYNYIVQRRTPAPNLMNPVDGKVCAILDAQKCTVDAILPKFNEYLRLVSEISEKEKERDNLKDEIVAYLQGHGLEGIGNGETSYKLGIYTRKSVDVDKLKKAGLYEEYLGETTYLSFRKGKF